MKSVVIVGYANSIKEVDWKTESEIWIMNDMYDFVPRFDRIFEIHTAESIRTRVTRREGLNHYEALKILENPIYMQSAWPEIPSSVRFPLDEIIKEFYIPAMGDKIFITCTVSHMLALAIFEGFEEISLLGVDQAIDTEYEVEMPSVLYWLGIAQGRGIKVHISQHSPLLKGYFVYGYDDKGKQKITEFIDGELTRMNGIKQKAINHQEYYMAEENKCIGAETAYGHLKKLFTEI